MYSNPYVYWQPSNMQPAFPYDRSYSAYYGGMPPQPAYANPYSFPAYHAHTETRQPQTDQGRRPFVVDIEKATKQNNTFRTAIWTGKHLQVVVMSLRVGEDIGLEVHPTVDQFLRIESGQGKVQMGESKNRLTFERRVSDDDAIMVPAGTWHNLTNTGNKPLKLYTIYAPPEHPFGTVQRTKAERD